MSAPNGNELREFEDAARLIAVNKSDVGWLSYGLLFWIWPQERRPAAARGKNGSGLGMFADFARMRRGRAEVLRALTKTLPRAAKKLEDLTSDWTLRQFLVDDALGPGFGPLDHVSLITLLREICRRGMEASRSPDLVAPSGKAKAGRNRALAPGQVDEKVACAATVMVAWKIVRGGETPGPQTRGAAEAAQILFALGSAPAGRYDMVRPRRKWGGDPIKTWRPYFKAAALPSPALARLNAMCAGELEFIRKWHAGDPAARAFPTMLAVNPPRSEAI
jgi:hypothetical protein